MVRAPRVAVLLPPDERERERLKFQQRAVEVSRRATEKGLQILKQPLKGTKPGDAARLLAVADAIGAMPVGVGAVSQRLIPTGERSGLQTRIAATENVSSDRRYSKTIAISSVYSWSHCPPRICLILAGRTLFSSSRSLRACWRAALLSFL
jgi:hypothetical protein